MRKLFLHVGFAKCGSTSLQESLSCAPGIVFPKSGNHGGEHLALALRLRGIDDWTRQFFDETWVEKGMAGIIEEIASTLQTVVLSSERLAAISQPQIDSLKALFPDFEIHVILVRRELQRYLISTWRHAVYRHDFAEPFDVFLTRFTNFSFGDAEVKFGRNFPVHAFDMEAEDYAEAVGTLIGTTVTIPQANVGIPREFAELLQKTHTLLGSAEFKKFFDVRTKKAMLDVWNGNASVTIEPMTPPLF